jgi:hypothetical protein
MRLKFIYYKWLNFDMAPNLKETIYNNSNINKQ